MKDQIFVAMKKSEFICTGSQETFMQSISSKTDDKETKAFHVQINERGKTTPRFLNRILSFVMEKKPKRKGEKEREEKRKKYNTKNTQVIN